MLKMRAPGAKTFLQVIKARFGKRTHLVFCTFAFLTNVIVSRDNSRAFSDLSSVAGDDVSHGGGHGSSEQVAPLLPLSVLLKGFF